MKPRKTRIQSDDLLRYLKGDLDGDQRYEIEQQLERSALSREALEGLSQSKLSAEMMEDEAAELRQRWAQREGVGSGSGSSMLRWVAAAAAVLLLLWIGGAYWQEQQEQQLFAEYFTPEADSGPIRIRGEGTEGGAFEQAYAWYEAQEYEKSLAAFQSLLAEQPDAGNARLYAGISALQLGRTFEAEAFLGALAKEQGEEAVAAHWYLALLYVQEGRTADALDQLDWLTIFAEGEYLEKAQALIREVAPVN